MAYIISNFPEYERIPETFVDRPKGIGLLSSWNPLSGHAKYFTHEQTIRRINEVRKSWMMGMMLLYRHRVQRNNEDIIHKLNETRHLMLEIRMLLADIEKGLHKNRRKCDKNAIHLTIQRA